MTLGIQCINISTFAQTCFQIDYRLQLYQPLIQRSWIIIPLSTCEINLFPALSLQTTLIRRLFFQSYAGKRYQYVALEPMNNPLVFSPLTEQHDTRPGPVLHTTTHHWLIAHHSPRTWHFSGLPLARRGDPVERRNDDLHQLVCCAGGVRCRRQADVSPGDWRDAAPSGVRCRAVRSC